MKYISIVDLFPTLITDQCSLSLEKKRAAPAQTLIFVLCQKKGQSDGDVFSLYNVHLNCYRLFKVIMVGNRSTIDI